MVNVRNYRCEASGIDPLAGQDIVAFAYLVDFQERFRQMGDEVNILQPPSELISWFEEKYGGQEKGFRQIGEHVLGCENCSRETAFYDSEITKEAERVVRRTVDEVIDEGIRTGKFAYKPDQIVRDQRSLRVGLGKWYKDDGKKE